MTIQEAIYCMRSYLPDNEDSCYKCHYYGANKVDDQLYVCDSSEAHRMAIQALELKLELEEIEKDVETKLNEILNDSEEKFNSD